MSILHHYIYTKNFIQITEYLSNNYINDEETLEIFLKILKEFSLDEIEKFLNENCKYININAENKYKSNILTLIIERQKTQYQPPFTEEEKELMIKKSLLFLNNGCQPDSRGLFIPRLLSILPDHNYFNLCINEMEKNKINILYDLSKFDFFFTIKDNPIIAKAFIQKYDIHSILNETSNETQATIFNKRFRTMAGNRSYLCFYLCSLIKNPNNKPIIDFFSEVINQQNKKTNKKLLDILNSVKNLSEYHDFSTELLEIFNILSKKKELQKEIPNAKTNIKIKI